MAKAKRAALEAVQQKQAISAAVLTAFFDGSDAQQVSEKVASAEQPRIRYLFGFFPNSDLRDIQDATKGMRKAAKDEHGDNSPQYRTAKTRSGEVSALYGAWRFADFKPDGMGYKVCVEKARESLKAKKIRPNGASIPEKWERDVNKLTELHAAEFKEVEMARRRAEQSGKELSDKEAGEIRERARDALERSGANDFAERLFKQQTKRLGADKGILFCQHVVEHLETLIAALGQEIKEQEQAKQKEQEPQQKAA